SRGKKEDDNTLIINCIRELEPHGAFPPSHIGKILAGTRSTRIAALGHARLSSYGTGAHLTRHEWTDTIRALIARGVLAYADDQSQGVVCSPPQANREAPASQLREDSEIGAHDQLFDRLREVRSQLAATQGYAPFMVAHDRHLREMVERMPDTREEIARMSGMGEKRAAKYGDAFLAVIREYRSMPQVAGREPPVRAPPRRT
ncbi:MAG: HRDC domain-containing protein, partial [Methanomicrobiales archaeon]|nr:HRDC domain-containing protein [Methanomicrobiales archaeon]